MFRRLTCSCLIAAAVGVAASATRAAVSLSVIATEDTYVSNHPNLGGPNATHGGLTDLYAIGEGAGNSRTYYTIPLSRFDLTGLSGTVSRGSFNAYYASNYYGVANDVTLRPVLVGWTEAAATYNNFGPVAGVQWGSDTGEAMSTVTLPGSTTGYYVPWEVTASLVQSWVTTPESNNGVSLVPVDVNSTKDVTFKSREAGWTRAPYLAITFITNTTLADDLEGRELNVNGGHRFTVNQATLTLHQDIRLGIDGSGSGSLHINGGTVTANHLIGSQATVSLNGGTLSLRSITLHPSQFDWTAGVLELRDSGTIALPGEATDLSAGRTFRITRDTGPATLQLAGLSIGIAGVGEHGKLEATGTGTPAAVQRGGVLNLYLQDGFIPSHGDRFDLFDWGLATGTFTAINLPELGEGLRWDTSELYTTGVVSVAPEPSVGALLAALSVLLVRRRRGSNHLNRTSHNLPR